MKLELCQPCTVVEAVEGQAPTRTIMGLAVPWNTTAYASTGPVRFLPGSIPMDGPAPKLIRNHDLADPIGIVTERVATDDGVMFSARISSTAAGDEALTLAADGVLDAVSVGVDVLDHEFDGNVMVVKASRWRELSMVTFGAFDTARIHQVAAEADTTPETDNPETQPETETETEAPVTEATIPTSPIVVANAAPITTRPRVTAAEYLSAVISGKPLPEVAAANNLLGDIPGLLPEFLIGEVWQTQYAARPLCDAVGVRAMPQAGEFFNRRYVDTHTSVAQQVNQLDALSSTAMVVEKLLFTKRTFGGYITLSDQAASWSEPALVQAILNDMIRQYSRATDAYVAGQIDAVGGDAATLITTPTDGDQWIASLYDAADELFSATGAMPTHLLVNSKSWAAMGQAADGAGQRIFPYLGPSNAAGTSAGVTSMTMNPLGMSVVVSNDIAYATGNYQALVVYAPAIEVYEERRNAVRVDNPSTASATLGLWGFMAAGVLPPVAGAGSYVKSLFAA